jgi:PhnB protein
VESDSPDADHVSFGLLVADNGFRLAAYDVFGSDESGLASSGLAGARRADGLTHTEPFFLVLNGDTRDDIAPLWDGLAADGTVIQALAPSTWAPAYGMLTDRYGVTWIFGAAS